MHTKILKEAGSYVHPTSGSLSGPCGSDDLAKLDNPSAQNLQAGTVMARDDDGHALVGHLGEQTQDSGRDRHVEGSGRLISDEQAGPGDEGPHDGDPLKQFLSLLTYLRIGETTQKWRHVLRS